MSVGDITHEAVLAAMDEFDRIGLEGFRDQYRFGVPRDYWALRPGSTKRYPAKAIVGVAHGHMPGGTSLRSDQFFGGQGEQAANSILRKLGFEIVTGAGTEEGGSGPSDRVRAFVMTTYVEPARRNGEAEIELVSGDIHRAMRLENLMPVVCQVLEGRKFAEMAGVTLVSREGPERSSTVRYRFDLAGTGKGDNWAEAELSRRYGSPFIDNAKMLAWSLPDGRQVALEKLARAQIWLEGENLSKGGPDAEVYGPDRGRHSNLPERLKAPNVASKVVVPDLAALQTIMDQYDANRGNPKLLRLRERFLAKYPDFERLGGFSAQSGVYYDSYRQSVDDLLQQVAECREDPNGVLDALLTASKAQSRGARPPFFDGDVVWRVPNARQSDQAKFDSALRELLTSTGDLALALETFNDSFWPLLQQSAKGRPFRDTRVVPSTLFALIEPALAISVRYQFYSQAYRLLNEQQLFKDRPMTASEYEAVLEMARSLFASFEEWNWQPTDLWDVHAFILASCGDKLDGAVQEMDPSTVWLVTSLWGREDGLPRFIERGEWSLLTDTGSENNRRVREMQVGDRIYLKDFIPRATELPFDANGGIVTAHKIRAEGIVSEASQDGLRVGVDWRSLEEPRTWYFYTNNDAVWRLKDPQEKNPLADRLRQFLLENEPQDYAWFLNYPLWRDRLFGKPKEAISVTKPTNLILHGPPGTGKTYRTALEAVTLCDGDADYGEDEEGRAALMQRYGDLVKEKRIEFVTFHQNFGYEDFVEGLRPTTGSSDGQTAGGFELKPEAGIFRRIADRAAAPVMKADEAFSLENRSVFKLSLGEAGKAEWDWVFEDSLEGGYALLGFKDIDWTDDRFEERDQILSALQQRYPDETFSVLNGDVKSPDRFRNRIGEGDVVIVSKGLNAFRAIGLVEGPYEYAPRADGDYSHRRRVRWLWDDPDGVDVHDISEKRFSLDTVYELPKSRLNTAEIERLVNAAAASEVEDESAQREPHVLIIDEINRANISKVFGELITLLEPDKRLGQANALTVRLPYSKREFGVPSNLHVIGTMNTADRSIALLDTALRRRFRFEEIAPEPWRLGTVDGISLSNVLTIINQRIEYLIDRDHRIGHAFFMGDGGKDRRAIDATMRDKVIPLLQEYFFEDWSRIASVVGDGFLEKTVLKAPPGIQGEARDSWAVRNAFLPDAYDRLLKGSLPDEGEGAPTDDDGDE